MQKSLWYVMNKDREIFGAFDSIEDAKHYANSRPGYFVIPRFNQEYL